MNYKYDKEMSFLPSVQGKDCTEANISYDENDPEEKSPIKTTMECEQNSDCSTFSPKVVPRQLVFASSPLSDITNYSPLKQTKVSRANTQTLQTIGEESTVDESEVYSQETTMGVQTLPNEKTKDQDEKKDLVLNRKLPGRSVSDELDMFYHDTNTGAQTLAKEKTKDQGEKKDQELNRKRPAKGLPPSLQSKMKKQEEFEERRQALRQHLLSQEKREAKKKRRTKDDGNSSEVAQIALKILKKMDVEEEDHISLFLDSMTLRLKSLPARACRRILLTIDELVVQAEEFNEDLKNGTSQLQKPEILVRGFGLNISKDDIDTLSPKGLLNDQIMNFYLSLLTQHSSKVYCSNTFFMEQLLRHSYEDVKNWTKNVDIFSFSVMLVPINRALHWTLAIINFQEESIKFYNSLGPNLYEDCLEALKNYLKNEHVHRRKEQLAIDSWNLGSFIDGPKQDNSWDCGIFVLEMARCFCLGKDVWFTQQDIGYIRRRIRDEILSIKIR
ncbi:Sentrin-specific protease 1 [Frankliniella fusca]|uniref:Sentrin-specific protease 1 n=1 Tax=Frankliniella fusca TaxID=407009 RepID=A0AAE1HEA0_9NEOP|nr:Sentrin-specific protease 1 [Frankliniella fusca]